MIYDFFLNASVDSAVADEILFFVHYATNRSTLYARANVVCKEIMCASYKFSRVDQSNVARFMGSERQQQVFTIRYGVG